MFSSLQNRNFRNYVLAQFVSQLGTWIQQVAIGWVVFHMTQSPFWLGAVASAAQLPTFCLVLFAGIVADRFDRRKLMLFTQGLSALQALLLAILSYQGNASLEVLLGLSVILGILSALDLPARQALVSDMGVPRADFANAIALVSMSIHGSRMLGPVIAGVLLATANEGLCFLLNFGSFVPLFFVLCFMKTTPPAAPKNETGIVNSFKIGVQAAFGNTSIRYALFLLAFLNFFGAPYSSLLPAFADRLAPGDTQMLGFITAFSGTGSLLGALMLARLRRSPIGTLIGIHAILFSLGLMLLVFPKTLILVTGGAFLAGLGLLVSIASSNTVIQTLVANDKRARVMGIYNFAVLGTLPFGSLLMGWVTQSIGLQKAMFIHGSICILGSVLFFICAPSIDQATRPEPQPEPQPASPEVKAS